MKKTQKIKNKSQNNNKQHVKSQIMKKKKTDIKNSEKQK